MCNVERHITEYIIILKPLLGKTCKESTFMTDILSLSMESINWFESNQLENIFKEKKNVQWLFQIARKLLKEVLEKVREKGLPGGYPDTNLVGMPREEPESSSGRLSTEAATGFCIT